jgi:hypothetical protein
LLNIVPEEFRHAAHLRTEAPPLSLDESGAVRVGKTRVLLMLVIQEFQWGATPEDIVSA